MVIHYIFWSEAIKKMKFCPYCGAEIMQVTRGDYLGVVQCFDCIECERELEFYVLEELDARYGDWREKIEALEGEK
ncbi:hypothetical protein ETC03_12325 [Geobacillus sp. MMMUD3]|nr:hypothetical protein [Geobacillus sp. MMMUD3]